ARSAGGMITVPAGGGSTWTPGLAAARALPGDATGSAVTETSVVAVARGLVAFVAPPAAAALDSSLETVAAFALARGVPGSERTRMAGVTSPTLCGWLMAAETRMPPAPRTASATMGASFFLRTY